MYSRKGLMTDINLAPTYNLKAVLKETGLKADTLRAWERRYGLPEPARSSGGHRLFSQHDINTLKWLITRQDEGLSISRAVDLWRSIVNQDQAPLQVMPIGLPHSRVAPPMGGAVEELRHAWIEACMAFDESCAEQLLTQAFAQFSPETVCLEVLVKGLSEIGESWYQGKVSAQQEHLASSLASRRIDALLTAAPPPTYPGKILILCPPDDAHTFSPLVLTYLLRRRGRMAIFLGANVPLQHFDETLQSLKPQLVAMAAQDLRAAAGLLPFSEIVGSKDIHFAFGGRIFNLIPELRDHIPGHFLGESLAQGLDELEQQLSRRPKQVQARSKSTEYQKAETVFTQQQAALIARLSVDLHPEGIRPHDLTRTHLQLTESVIAALELGNLHFLAQEMDWFLGLEKQYAVPVGSLDAYIRGYQQAAQAVMGSDAQIVLDYLEGLISPVA
ncbi:MAG: MerR family transcriptional regulator [Anaerolineales bacterium]|nr:MAG: MerR family transcriptional regulator [Anaerolineales bacterium]